jgi:hypothetical protein
MERQETFKVVDNISVLKGMEKKGLIKFHPQTGTKIIGLYSNKKFTCYYIDEAVGRSRFTYNDKEYIVKYVDGCFCPFVFEIISI